MPPAERRPHDPVGRRLGQARSPRSVVTKRQAVVGAHAHGTVPRRGCASEHGGHGKRRPATAQESDGCGVAGVREGRVHGCARDGKSASEAPGRPVGQPEGGKVQVGPERLAQGSPVLVGSRLPQAKRQERVGGFVSAPSRTPEGQLPGCHGQPGRGLRPRRSEREPGGGSGRRHGASINSPEQKYNTLE